MKTGGFITIHRQILDWEWFKNVNTFVLFLYLLLTANYEDGRFEGKTIKRGQLVTSLQSLSIGTGLTIQQVRTALSHLISTGEITDEPTNKYRVITVIKYSDYQDATDRSTINQQSTNNQSTGNQQSNNNQITINQQQYNNNNNNNKGTNKQGNNNISFDRFWAAYPRKEGKPKAKTVFDRIKPDEELLQRMLDSIEQWKRTDQWQEDGGRYIPHPSTWLNQKRWEDEPMPSQQKPQKVLPAQDFQQRDYSGVDAELMSDLAKEMAEFKRQQQGG